MSSMELNALRGELAHDILNIEDIEVLKEVKRNLHQIIAQAKDGMKNKSSYPQPYTLEEIHSRIAESEAQIAAGNVLTNEEVFANMRRKYPWLYEDQME